MLFVVDQEACQWETYKAECPAGEVVVMRAAAYGRMQYGRCVKRDYGYVGCFTDVTPCADARYVFPSFQRGISVGLNGCVDE